MVFKDHPSSPNWTLDFWARVFSAVFTHLEPTILFSHSSAVSHLKPRDFRFHEPAIPFCQLVSGFLHRKWYDVILWARDRSRPIRSLHFLHTSPLYYWPPSLSTGSALYQELYAQISTLRCHFTHKNLRVLIKCPDKVLSTKILNRSTTVSIASG